MSEAGITLGAWREQIRAAMQFALEMEVSRLAETAPSLLEEGGPRFTSIEVTIPMIGNERVVFRASLELVE